MLVEAALVIPILLLLIFGMIEFGFIFKDTLTLSSMTRAGVRTGAVVGNSASPNPDADYQILMAIKAADGALSSQIQTVVIYKASANDDSVPQQCLVGTATQTSALGVAGECNIYSGAELKSLASDWATEQTTGQFNCSASALNQFWCPSSRVVSEAQGPDYVGVYISALHNNVTVWFHTITLHDQAVMRLEPQTL